MADPSASFTLLEACWRDLVLGVIQGLTEFLPISSTAHLKVVPELLGWGDPGVSVIAAIQLGSVVAVIANVMGASRPFAFRSPTMQTHLPLVRSQAAGVNFLEHLGLGRLGRLGFVTCRNGDARRAVNFG